MSVSGYELAILKRREDPAQVDFVRSCYLDEPLDAARRFAASAEFAEVRRILSLGPGGRGRRVLDVGAGNGIASFAFASLGCEVVALEPDPSAIVGAGAIASLLPHVGGGLITIAETSASQFRDPGNAFDIVYMRQAAHHFPVLEDGIVQCVEHLKPGGLFLMTREHVADTPEDVERFKQQHPGTLCGINEQAYSSKRYREAMTKAGLRNIREWGFFDSVINYYPKTAGEIRMSVCEWTRSCWGPLGSAAFRVSPRVERWACRWLSRRHRSPGRMHSFLGVKESAGLTPRARG